MTRKVKPLYAEIEEKETHPVREAFIGGSLGLIVGTALIVILLFLLTHEVS